MIRITYDKRLHDFFIITHPVGIFVTIFLQFSDFFQTSYFSIIITITHDKLSKKHDDLYGKTQEDMI